AGIPIGYGRGRRAVDGAQLQHRRVAGDFTDFARPHSERAAVEALDPGGAGANANAGRVFDRTGFHVVVALGLQGDGAAWCDDLIRLGRVEREGLDVDPAAIDLQPGPAV